MNESKNETSSKLILTIVITVVLTTLIIGGGTFAWVKYSQMKSALETAQKSDTDKTDEESPEITMDPTEVVESFLKSTIATIPGGAVNDEKAKTYLTDSLKSEYKDSGFPKEIYGIVNQNWPNDVRIDSNNAESDEKVVINTSGDWSSLGTPSNYESFCDFTTILIGDTFKISKIETHLFDNEFRIPEGF